MREVLFYCLTLLLAVSCEIVDNDMDKHVQKDSLVTLEQMAHVIANLPLTTSQMMEVHDAVVASSVNGYDEEYTMRNVFSCPGAGVGDEKSATRAGDKYEVPLKSLIEDYVRHFASVRSGAFDEDPQVWLDALSDSDVQIYWPFSEEWDGVTYPVITYDPEDNSDRNIGYRISIDDDGSRCVEEILVDEELARECPVWVINRNSDASYKTLELLRREDPDWGNGGGTIIVKPSSLARNQDPQFGTDDGLLKDDDYQSEGKVRQLKSDEGQIRTLMLKDFTMNRNYDSWLAGASEFFVKIGSVEDFTASTEAELRLYNPAVTDFMIVVRRNQIGKPQPFNAILVSEWTEQMETCAFMITEDDGGTVKDWNCTAFVRIASKSYGIEMKIPFNSFDDVVWRGSLTRKWFDTNNGVQGQFGDVALTFEVL